MLFLVATNVVASRPPERQPTGTPHARAKITDLAENVRVEGPEKQAIVSCSRHDK